MRAAIRAAGIPAEEYGLPGRVHLGLEDCPCPEKFKFAFVRDPVEMYRSYWTYKMGRGWDPANEIDQTCRSDDFRGFVTCVLEHYPGVLGSSFAAFVGPEGGEIEFVGRHENLREDLITALSLAGESFDPEAIRSLPPKNVSDRRRFPARYSEELEAAVRASEAEALRRFGYEPGRVGSAP